MYTYTLCMICLHIIIKLQITYNTCADACGNTYVFKSSTCQVTAQFINPSVFCIHRFEGRKCQKSWEGLEDWRMNG